MDDIKINVYNIMINNKPIILNYPVKMFEEINDLYIILLNIPTRTELGSEELNNIICYSNKGDFMWRVDNKLPGQIVSSEQSPYIAIQIQDDILKATDFFGRRFRINPIEGKLIDYEIVG